MSRLAGRVAVVTGAGSGLGRATAHRLAADGASVVVADIDAERAATVATELDTAGHPAIASETDVSVETDVAAMIALTVERFGRIDILHNNAAALGADVFGRDGAITAMDVDVWDATMAVNLKGAMLGCKHAVPAMIPGGGGVIVNTSSVSALVGEANHVAYACSKAALAALTRHVANMHGADGIRVNAIAPGLMLTPVALDRLDERQLQMFRRERLLDRAATPEDVASLVAFLASDEAACITGQVYVIDGGTTVKRPRAAMVEWERFVAADAE